MAKIKVESQSTGTGIYTLKTGTASTNYSATLPDSTGTLSTEKLTTKGDLEVYGTAPDRLAVGTNDYLLTADSTAANGVAWKAAAGGGKVLQVVHGGMGLGYINTTSTSWQNAFSTTITVNKGSDVLFEVGGLNARISNASYTCRTKVEATDGTNTAFWYSGTNEIADGCRITNSTLLTTASGVGTVVVTVTLYYNTEYSGATAYLYDYSDYYKTFYKIWEISA